MLQCTLLLLPMHVLYFYGPSNEGMQRQTQTMQRIITFHSRDPSCKENIRNPFFEGQPKWKERIGQYTHVLSVSLPSALAAARAIARACHVFLRKPIMGRFGDGGGPMSL